MKKETKRGIVKAITRGVLLILAIIAVLAFTGSNQLEIGDKAPQTKLKMKDVSGEMLSLQNVKEERGLLVVFSCNTCPFVVGNWAEDENGEKYKKTEGWEGRYNTVYEHARENGIGMVLVNSNETKRDGDDSFINMQKRANENNYKSHYVMDTNNKLADAFGAKTTPHIFLFDKEMKLVYKGAIDDNVGSASEVKVHWLKNAITNLAASKKIDPATTRNIGCSIKRAG